VDSVHCRAGTKQYLGDVTTPVAFSHMQDNQVAHLYLCVLYFENGLTKMALNLPFQCGNNSFYESFLSGGSFDPKVVM